MMLRKNIIAGIVTLFSGLLVYAQKGTHTPKQDYPPVDMTKPENLIIYIVIPLIFVVLYFLWRDKEKKKNKNNQS